GRAGGRGGVTGRVARRRGGPYSAAHRHRFPKGGWGLGMGAIGAVLGQPVGLKGVRRSRSVSARFAKSAISSLRSRNRRGSTTSLLNQPSGCSTTPTS